MRTNGVKTRILDIYIALIVLIIATAYMAVGVSQVFVTPQLVKAVITKGNTR